MFAGDSVVDGANAGGPTGFPPELTVYDRSGVDQLALGDWDAAPGFIPWVVDELIALGFDDIRVYQEALATMKLNTILFDFVPQALERIRIAGDTPDIVFVGTGVNNTFAGESQLIPGYIRHAGQQLAKLHPSCGFILFENISEVGDPLDPLRPEVQLARDYFQAWAETRDNWYSVSGLNRTDSGDYVHFTLGTFQDMGAESITDGFVNFP